jgi:hypothetical protein
VLFTVAMAQRADEVAEGWVSVEDGLLVVTDTQGQHVGSRPLRKDENPLDAARRLLRERAGFTASISYPRLFNLA